MAGSSLSRVLSAPGLESDAGSPVGGLSPLCEFKGLSVYVVRLSEQPALVRHITRLRATAFGEGGPWNYGLDDQDERALQLIACEASEPVGALRLCLGDELVAHQGLAAFYLNTGWSFSPEAETFFSTAMEYGRFWALRGHPRTQTIMNALLFSLGAFARLHPGYQSVFGTVSLLDHDVTTLTLIADYLRRHHLPSVRRVLPLRPFTSDVAPASAPSSRASAFRALVRQLKTAVPRQSLPFLLHLYLRQGAQMLGDVALDATGRKLLIPLFVDMRTFQGFAERLRLSAGLTEDPRPED